MEKNKYSIGFLVNLTLECCHIPMLSNFYKFYADYEYFDKKNFIYALYKFLLSKVLYHKFNNCVFHSSDFYCLKVVFLDVIVRKAVVSSFLVCRLYTLYSDQLLK